MTASWGSSVHAGRALLFVGVVGLLCPGLGAQQSRIDDLPEYVRGAMAQWRVPGLTLSIVAGDSTVLVQGFGRTRSDSTGRPVGPDTRFAIGSCSKAFTATAVGALVSDGVLAWDTPVQEVLPELTLQDPWVTRELQIDDLITNRVGLEHGSRFRRYAQSQTEYLSNLRYLSPRFSFRSRYGYSNDMFLLAEAAAVAAGGTEWEPLLRERILDPLGMSATTTVASSLEGIQDKAFPHVETSEGRVPVPWEESDPAGTGAGGFISSATDMARWLAFHLQDGRADEEQLVSADVAATMHRPQTPASGTAIDGHLASIVGEGPDGLAHWAYGMGWFINDYRGHPLVWHSGAVTGFSCMAMFLPEDGIGVYVGVNSLVDYLHYGVALWIVDALLGFDEADWSGQFHASYTERLAAYRERAVAMLAGFDTMSVPTVPLEEFSGSYVAPGLPTAVVAVGSDGRLELSLGPDRWVLEHMQYDTFRAVPVDRTLPRTSAEDLRPPLVHFHLGPNAEVQVLDLSRMELGEFLPASPSPH